MGIKKALASHQGNQPQANQSGDTGNSDSHFNYLALYLQNIRPSSLRLQEGKNMLDIWYVALRNGYKAEIITHDQIDITLICSSDLSVIMEYLHEHATLLFALLYDWIALDLSKRSCYDKSQSQPPQHRQPTTIE